MAAQTITRFSPFLAPIWLSGLSRFTGHFHEPTPGLFRCFQELFSGKRITFLQGILYVYGKTILCSERRSSLYFARPRYFSTLPLYRRRFLQAIATTEDPPFST